MSPSAEPIRVPAGGLADARVGLRAWRTEDAPALAEAWADGDIARWTATPAETSIATARRWINGIAPRLEAGRSVDFVICEIGADTVMGEVGLAPIDWERRAAQVGYWLRPDARGRGLATAALGLVTAWATRELSLRALVARCHPENAASAGVAEAAGYDLERVDPEGFQLYVNRGGSSSC